ncbi:unnamed protein product [Clavelina lepadiformis]|uniref:O-fucosyltransferase family protein n=1 Tax=Clavelina lepadiformis TaxID=159417 RepID=A0ABP0GD42_CLALP
MIEAIETDKISILPIRNIFQSSSTIASTRKKSDVPKEQDVIPTQHVMKIYPDSPKKSTIASVISRKVSVKSPSSSKMKIRCSLWEEPTYKQSVYVAIRLNRTLVIPRFATHYATGKVLSVPANQIIDVDILCSFVSCISIEEFRKACHGSVDVLFQAMETRLSDITRFENDAGMNVSRVEENDLLHPGAINLQLSQNGKKSNIPAFPSTSYKMTHGPWLSSSEKSIREAYNSTVPCALLAKAFHPLSLEVKDNIAVPLHTKEYEIKEIKNNVLYSAIVHSVRRPKCVTEAAEAYIDANIGTDEFVTIHWRYDNNDWLRVFSRFATCQACKFLKNISAEDVAQAVINNLPLLRGNNDTQPVNTVSVYIATPPSLKEFKLKILSHLKTLDFRMERVPLDLKVYLTEKGFENCWKNSNWVSPSEILSLVEMEIIRRSNYFFYSILSTWSGNIRPLRWKRSDGKIKKMFEASILDLAKSEMTKRMNSN